MSSADLSHLIDAGFGNAAGPVGVVYRFVLILSILWTAIQWFTSDAAVLYPALRRIAAVSIILWLALNWPGYTEAFVSSMSRLGVRVGTGDGVTAYNLVDVNRPSSFGEHAFTTAFRLYDYALSLKNDDWFPSFAFMVKGAMLLITALVVFGCGAAVVILILTYMVLFKVGTVVVFVLLPFMLSDQTKWMCERALGWLVSCGVRFMVLSMVIGFLYAVAQKTIGDLGDGVTSVGGIFQVLLFNLLLLVFVALANRFAGEIAGGAASLSLAGVAQPVLAGANGAAQAGKMAAVAGVVGGVAAGVAGKAAYGQTAKFAGKVRGGSAGGGGGGAAGGGPAPGSAPRPAAPPVTSAATLARASAASRMRPASPPADVIDAEWSVVPQPLIQPSPRLLPG